MESILVTGGAGFIGSHIVDCFIEKGYRVVVIDNLSSGKEENINSKCVFYRCDILSQDIEKIFQTEDIKYVFHFAAQISVTASKIDPKTDALVNIIGTNNLLEFSKKYNVTKFFAASSAAVYGDISTLIAEENIPCPISNYGLSKLTMEKYIQLSGLDYVIFRFANVYGLRQRNDGEAGVITIFNDLIKRNGQVSIFGSGEQKRDFIFIKDLVKIIYEILNSSISNEVINVSTACGITINELFNIFKNLYNYPLSPKYENKRVGDIDISVLSNEKLLKFLPHVSFTNIEDGINSFIEKDNVDKANDNNSGL